MEEPSWLKGGESLQGSDSLDKDFSVLLLWASASKAASESPNPVKLL